MDAAAEWHRWCTDPVFDEQTRAQVRAMSEEERQDAFYCELSFGTGGLRGIIGAGTNRMNVYTVGKATQGLADFIRTQSAAGSVVIAYDSRRMSKEFALDSACILAANGIRTYLFEDLRPTPELSFAVRRLGATAGIVITASHNPPAYNGYKVYWSDGGQIVPPYDARIIASIGAVADYASIRRMSAENAKACGLLSVIGKEVDDAYTAEIEKLVLRPALVREMGKKLKIVYTPLHGTGNLPVRRVLAELGFEHVYVVPEQEAPDGDFPTVEYPNPEDKRAFRLALELAERVGADLVLATDPDADRLGVYCRTKDGGYYPFTGNMSGLLIAQYLLSAREELGMLPARRADGALVTTIVSSDMVYPVAARYGLTVIRTLTGFKYIGEQIKKFEQALAANGGIPDAGKGAYVYEFGFEESYGCLVGTYARDKDAVMAVTALCEAAAYYASLGKTLADVMSDMYEMYGYYAEDLASVTLKGADGARRIADMMSALRCAPPAEVGGRRVAALCDYACGLRRELSTGREEPCGLPKSNVLYFELEGDAWCCVRPSGTEPKIKFYFGVKGNSCADSKTQLAALRAGFLQLFTED